jgi:hypothetical protein
MVVMRSVRSRTKAAERLAPQGSTTSISWAAVPIRQTRAAAARVLVGRHAASQALIAL